MNKIKNFFKKNHGIILLISLILIMIFGIMYRITNNTIYLNLLITPVSYFILYTLILIIFAWIINPIIWLKNKIKK